MNILSVLREAINNLSEGDRQQLMYAFEEGLSQWIELPDGKFVGVNVQGLPQLTIIEQSGLWAYGDINDGC